MHLLQNSEDGAAGFPNPLRNPCLTLKVIPGHCYSIFAHSTVVLYFPPSYPKKGIKIFWFPKSLGTLSFESILT